MIKKKRKSMLKKAKKEKDLKVLEETQRILRILLKFQ